MAKKPESSRVPDAVGALPLVGGLVRNADAQARWMQDLLEQNARLIGQLPATIKTFNDSLERFNQTLSRLDKAVTQLERTSRTMTGPVDRVAALLDPRTLAELPGSLDALRQTLAAEALPALRAAGDTQTQVALLQTTLERVLAILADLPGAGILRRITRGDAGAAPPPSVPAASRKASSKASTKVSTKVSTKASTRQKASTTQKAAPATKRTPRPSA